VTLTFSENVTGTQDTTDWELYGVTGAPVAPTTVTISTNTVVLDFSASTIANGDTVELSYYGGDVADGDGIQIGYVTKYAVTNNVP